MTWQIQKAEIMVCVLSKTGQPLMPTKNHGMVRKLLKTGKAKVVRRTPFTVQMLITTHCYRQPVSLGIDAGSKTVGVSAAAEKKELYAAQIALRNDVTEKLADCRAFRRARRNRKRRHRKARFQNRRKGKEWPAPSVRQKIETICR